nr:patatin-like phospholipase family protein [Moraxella catarrhalis]
MRGFAHIGAIESLEAHGIRPDMVVGTSWGTGGCSVCQW